MNNNTLSEYLEVDVKQTGPIPLNARFSCNQNELIVLVGPSGSGKTTLLRSIAGLYQPVHSFIKCAGNIWSDNQNRINRPAQSRSTGFVFQHYALFPHLTVAKNIELACGQILKQEKEKYIYEMLQLVNLEGLEKRLPAQLSGGQQQRVALARALAREPAILLLDEPFSAVDQVTRRKLRRELARLRQKLNIPIVLVTHDLDEARMLADRMCILHDGVILQTGTPMEVFSKPVNAEVARLVDLGNLFSGEIICHEPDRNITYLKWGEYKLECALRKEFAPGAYVDWVIPPDSIILHRRDRPSRGEHENPVNGITEQVVGLGINSSISIKITGQNEYIYFNIPTHVVRRNNIYEGENISVSLLANAIHLMPKIN